MSSRGRIACVCVLTVLMVAGACTSGSDDPSAQTTVAPSTTREFVPPQRDPYFWPHSSDSVWNLGLGSDAVLAPDDDPMTQSLRGVGSDASPAGISYRTFTHPISLARFEDPLISVELRDAYSEGSVTCYVDRGAGGTSRQQCDQTVSSVDMKMPPGLMADGGNCQAVSPGPQCDEGENTDGSLHVVQPDGTTLYSMFRTFGGGDTWVAARIAEWDLTNSGIAEEPEQQWGTRAYGGSDVAGLMRCWELEKVVTGEWTSFPHALAIAVNGSQLKSGSTQSETYLWPATLSDSGWPDYSGNLPMGALIAIDRDQEIDLSSKVASAIVETLKNYGGLVVDQTGGQFAAYAEPGCEMNEVLARAGFAMSDIQAVSTVVLNNGPESVNGGGSYPPAAPKLSPNMGRPYSGDFFPPIS